MENVQKVPISLYESTTHKRLTVPIRTADWGGMPPSPGKDGKMTIKEDMREEEGRNKASPLLSARKTDKEKETEPLGSAIV